MARKSTKTGADVVQENAMGLGHNQVVDVKALRALFEEGEEINQKFADLRADMKDVVTRAEDKGFKRKEFKQALKEHCKQKSMNDSDRELRSGVNQLLVAAGDAPLFAWGEEEKEAA